MVLNEFQDEKVKGRQADVMMAAFHAMEVALRLVKPGGEVSFLLNPSKQPLCIKSTFKPLFMFWVCAWLLLQCLANLSLVLLVSVGSQSDYRMLGKT